MVAPVRLESIRQKQSLKGTPAAMKKPYHIINRENAATAEKLQEFARANGQYLLPLVDLVTETRIAMDYAKVLPKMVETAGVSQQREPAGDRRQRPAAEPVARTPLGADRFAGDLYRRAAFRRASRDPMSAT